MAGFERGAGRCGVTTRAGVVVEHPGALSARCRPEVRLEGEPQTQPHVHGGLLPAGGAFAWGGALAYQGVSYGMFPLITGTCQTPYPAGSRMQAIIASKPARASSGPRSLFSPIAST